LSFTKKTVEELNERLTKVSVATKATTFHKLGYDTIKKHRADIPAVTNENTLSGVIKTYLRTDIFENAEALQAFIQYVACYMNIPEEDDNYESFENNLFLTTSWNLHFHRLLSGTDMAGFIRLKNRYRERR